MTDDEFRFDQADSMTQAHGLLVKASGRADILLYEIQNSSRCGGTTWKDD
jgi:hypothetical protein